MNKCSYITYLGNSQYLPGVRGLITSLEAVQAKFPLIVMIPIDINDDIKIELKKLKLNLVEVEPIKVDMQSIQLNSYWSKTFTKLALFDLTEYDKLVYLDADMLIKENIDSLFDQPHLTSVCAGHQYPGNESWKTLNSGLMVIEPQEGLVEKLVHQIDVVKYEKNGYGDQDVIHDTYPEWPNQLDLHLSEEYNLFIGYEAYYLSHHFIDKAKVIHFVGNLKPWMMSTKQRQLWKIRQVLKAILVNHSLRGLKTQFTDFDHYVSITK